MTPPPTPQTDALALDQAASARRRAAADFVMLTKPRLVTLVLVTTLVGFFLGSSEQVDLWLLFWTILGTGLAAGGSLALNQYVERDVDGRMERTRLRPLPDGRLSPGEALAFGALLSIVGLAVLGAMTNLLACAVTGATLAIYLLAYTPLKRRTSLATFVGAVPGALPPVTGWLASHGALGAGAGALFAILFFWQIPHFLALAWMYKDEYARAGIVVLPAADPAGTKTGRQMVLNLSALVLASLLPALLGLAGGMYLVCSLVLGAGFLASGIAFALAPAEARAKRVFFASLAYLPALLTLLAFGRSPG